MANLYALKPWYTRRLKIFLDFAVRRNISPDVFTMVGILGGVIAVAGFALDSWLIVVLGVAVRLAGANLDGAVARARNVSRPFGFVLNEIGDRVGDMLLFLGLTLAVDPNLIPYVLLTGLLSTLPTLVSVSGAAVKVPRINGGPFGKTERCLFFCIFPLVNHLTLVVVVMLALMGVGAVLTSCLRARRISTSLNAVSHG